MVLLDMSKAFDSLEHAILLAKLQSLGLFTIYIKNPSGFKLCKWNAKISIGKSRSEHALSISRKIGTNRK